LAGFDKNYATYLRFLRKEFDVTPSIQIAELTYINIVESCEYWTSAKDTGRVFPSFQFASPPKGISDPDFQQIMSERFAPDLTITSTIRNGAVPKPTGQVAALVFEAQVFFDDTPTRALQGIIAEGVDEAVGGSIQQAWAAGGQFFPVMNAVIVPAPQGSPNMAFNVLGYDMDGDQFTVGNHWAGLFGRF
jgi:hypothetical protein